MKLLLYFLFALLRWLAFFCVSAYAAAAIYFCAPFSIQMRGILCGLVLAGTVGPLLLARTWRRRLTFAGPVLIAVYGWYFSLQPTLDAEWAKDAAVLPEVDIQGDKLIVHHIRNFHYRSDTDFDVDYYDKEFDLNQVRTVDLFLSYWGTTSIAHTIMSFGFANGDYLPISIETRKKVGEEYSAVQGFFKKFELFYVVADERDVIGVRVNQRNEDVYLYRLKPDPEQVRKMLLDYVKTIDELETKPMFYNALTTNCTTSILPHFRTFTDIKFNWALLANGNIDRWRYDAGVWGKEIPFEEFRARSKINEKVKAAGNGADFSAKIREGLPSIKN